MYASFEDKLRVFDRIGYDPHEGQIPVHKCNERNRLVAGGERAGKSLCGAAELASDILFAPPGALYWLVAQTYELTRPEFTYVVEWLKRFHEAYIQTISWPRQGPCTLITKTGVTLETKTAEDPVKLAAKAPDGILMCEAAQMTEETYLRLVGRVAEKRGWLLLIGTFEGSFGWYVDLWKRWQGDNFEGGVSFSIPSWANTKIYPGGREDPEIIKLEKMYTHAMFMERCGAVPCPPATVVFPEFDYATHVSFDVKFNEKEDVVLAIDPGYRGDAGGSYYACLAMQFYGNDVEVIDELYLQKMVHEEVIYACKLKPWWKKVDKIVICHFGGRQHAQAGKAPIEVWSALTSIPVVSRPVMIKDGIYVLHTFLKNPADGRPRVKFNPACKGIFKEFGLYQYPKDKEGKPVSDKPIDRYCDSIKALIYALVDHYGIIKRKRRARWRSPFNF